MPITLQHNHTDDAIVEAVLLVATIDMATLRRLWKCERRMWKRIFSCYPDQLTVITQSQCDRYLDKCGLNGTPLINYIRKNVEETTLCDTVLLIGYLGICLASVERE